MNKEVLVSLKKISKSFAGVRALDEVDIDIVAGKVHGLIGANGAGKSTLVKIMAGVYQPDQGNIYVADKLVSIHDPSVSTSLGMSFIHQELNLVANFTIIENLSLGMKKEKNFGFIDWSKTAEKYEHVLDLVGFKQSVFTPMRDLSVAEQWLIAIAKAVYQNANVITMDEPTAALSQAEVKILFSIIREITARGIGVIFVSHKLDEIIEICDEVTVFKDGKKVLHADDLSKLTKEDIITAIAGHRVSAMELIDYKFQDAKVLLEARGLADRVKVKDISFFVKEGEVLGLTGLVGSGRTETLRMIYGTNKIKKGQLILNNQAFKPSNPIDAIEKGIVLVPEDRRKEGLITNQNLRFNVNLPTLEKMRKISLLPFISLRKGGKITQQVIHKLFIKAPGVNSPILNLSGGNQQKAVIGKWLQRNLKLVMMDEPTQGVDVGARAEIYKLIRKMAEEENVSFLIVSSDIEELPGLCDRVLVISEGKISGELVGSDIIKESILHLCYAN